MNIDPSVLKGFYTWGLSVYPCIVGQVMLETALDLPLPTEASYPDWEEVGDIGPHWVPLRAVGPAGGRRWRSKWCP